MDETEERFQNVSFETKVLCYMRKEAIQISGKGGNANYLSYNLLKKLQNFLFHIRQKN